MNDFTAEASEDMEDNEPSIADVADILLEKAANSDNATAAMNFAQAACNAANALRVLVDIDLILARSQKEASHKPLQPYGSQVPQCSGRNYPSSDTENTAQRPCVPLTGVR
jgi:hypothetical protein